MTMSEHLNVCISPELLIDIDSAAAKRDLNRSEFVRLVFGRVLSEGEYHYDPPRLPNWQVEAWTSLLRGLFSSEHLVLTDNVRALLKKAVATLNERDRQVIVRRFGLAGPRHTLAEVAAMMGVNRQRVHQIEAQALRRMRFGLARSGIWKLLESQLEKEGNG